MTDTELIALVATEVMGWTPWVDLAEDCDGPFPAFSAWSANESVWVYEDDGGDSRPWNPLEVPNDWWEVVEKMREDGYRFLIEGRPGKHKWVEFGEMGTNVVIAHTDRSLFRATCLAALRAKGVECE